MEKYSTIWLLTFEVTYLPKNMKSDNNCWSYD